MPYIAHVAIVLGLLIALGAGCDDSAGVGNDAGATADAQPIPDAGPADSGPGPDAGPPPRLGCHLLKIVPHSDAGGDRVRIRVWMGYGIGGQEVVLTEMDQVIGGSVRRTLPMTLIQAGSWPDPVFGFDGPAEPEEIALCAGLPPVEPFYFEMRGTVGGQPATGRCGFGPGEGGWPAEVRAACGEAPLADAAITNVIIDPIFAPGLSEILLMVRLDGPASGVTLTPEELIGDSAGTISTLAIGPGLDLETHDARADNPGTGPIFDGEVPPEGRDVYLYVSGTLVLGPEFCLDSPDPFGAPNLYVRGRSNSGAWTTSAFSCATQAPDQDWALP